MPVLSRSTTNGPSRRRSARRVAGEERARGEHDGGRVEAQARLRDRADHAPAFNGDVVDGLLEHGEVGLRIDLRADRRLVERAVGLRARGAHGRTLARVERAPLDAGAVRGARHGATERVDLLDQVALADAADRGIAAHLSHGLEAVREQQRARAGAGRGKRGLGAGMAAADHDHVVLVECAHWGSCWFGGRHAAAQSLRTWSRRFVTHALARFLLS